MLVFRLRKMLILSAYTSQSFTLRMSRSARWACLPVIFTTASSFATEQYCLSGGFRNGYSCEAPLVAEWSQDKVVFSIQLLESADQDHISSRDQVAHISSLPDDKRLVYLGGYASQADGMQALQRAVEEFGLQHFPMLVELTPSEQMPRIRLVAEPNRPEELTRSIVATASNELRYAIQLGAFKGPKDARKFSQQLSMPGLLCRQKDNGMHAVYYREFADYAEAQTRLNDNPLIKTLGGYVVALRNVEFSACNRGGETSETLVASAALQPSDVRPSSIALPPSATEQANTDSQSQNNVSAIQYAEVFTIQTAAFQQASSVQQFVLRNKRIPLSCRVKNNGMFAVYYGAYNSYSEAQHHLRDHALLTRQKAYVLRLRDVSFESCDNIGL